MRFHDLEEQIKKLKEELENLTDANDIIDEAFGEDGALKLFLGEAFVSVDEDAAKNYVEKVNEEKQEELAKLKNEYEDVEEHMRDLKSYLYAKFGNSINLEEKWDTFVWYDRSHPNYWKSKCKILSNNDHALPQISHRLFSLKTLLQN